uniref:Plastocyanin-like domain-containing protein n=1 Tax=Ananas comosus var. bracteatus TaxID=296719 RepID=A0A6V7QU50_ANACO
MFVTVGFNLLPCAQDQTRCGPVALAASMNSIVFQFPKRVSLLEAHFEGIPGIYTSNFPKNPPVIFDYTKGGNPFQASKGTELKKIRYNDVVEVVLQNTAIVGFENHPIHLHGFNFFVLAQGAGNYDPRVWFMHCHMDSHLPLGLAMAFEVENGNTPDSILPPPPPDYPNVLSSYDCKFNSVVRLKCSCTHN